jgi:hypothetical protein
MKQIDRRRFLLTTAAAAATLPGLRSLAQTAPATATLTLHPDKPGPHIPANFIGLSYETQQLSEPTFFSAANTGLIAQFKALAPNGVLRLGGNTSDYGFWKPTPSSIAPPRAHRDYKVGDPNPNLSYPVTPEAVHNLRAFLDATGWTCLYGINLGTNIPALAAEEAAAVATILGPKLEYLQLGNEADRFGSTIRDPATWSADAFLTEWLTFAHAILARVPTARFGMPDIASNAAWFSTIGDRLATDPIREHIACLSHHYYIGGPPSNPAMTIDHILSPHPGPPRDAALVTAAANKLNVPYRMTEGNTCYRGGKPGVSDVFASALWSADYLLQLASLGYAGVNLHGGDGQMVANSLGGTLPGDELVLAAHGDPTTHPHPYYTPIAHIGDKYLLEPVAYGMMFAQQFAGTTIIPIDFTPGSINATAYAAKRPNGKLILAIINKDSTNAIDVRVPKHGSAMLHELRASSLTSRDADFDNFNINHTPATCLPPGVCVGQGAGPKGTMTADDWLNLTVPAASAVIADLDHERREPI